MGDIGDLIGGISGTLGSIFGSNDQADAAKQAQDAALTGYNYLTGSDANNSYIDNGSTANDSIAQLLGQAPITEGTQNGFDNYLNSTGYNFNLQQGTNAIASQGAASGLLNSGGTGKALTQYGQNLGSQYFNNYLSQLGGLSQSGQQGLAMTADAGNQGGAAAAQAAMNYGDAKATGTQALFNGLGSLAGFFL